MDQTTEIWDRINTLIKIRNTTQNTLSADCGFSRRRISNLSSSNRLPDAIEITLIAQKLQTSVEYLVTGKSSNIAEIQLAELKKKLAELAK